MNKGNCNFLDFCINKKCKNSSEEFLCMLEYSKILVESCNKDFIKFCKDYNNCILYNRKEDYNDVVFAMHFLDDFHLIIKTEEHKITDLEISNLAMEEIEPNIYEDIRSYSFYG